MLHVAAVGGETVIRGTWYVIRGTWYVIRGMWLGKPCKSHPGESRDPGSIWFHWTPAFAGVTISDLCRGSLVVSEPIPGIVIRGSLKSKS